MGKQNPVKKIHIKKGDKVIVVSGSEKGSKGEVLEVLPGKYRAVIEMKGQHRYLYSFHLGYRSYNPEP